MTFGRPISRLTSDSLVSNVIAWVFVYANMNGTDQSSMSTENLAFGTQTVSGSLSNLSSGCMVTPQTLATTTTQSQQSTQPDQDTPGHRRSESKEIWVAIASDMPKQQSFSSNTQTKVDDACIISTSGVAMLQDLLTTATDAQRQLFPTVNCMPLQATEAQGSQERQDLCFTYMAREASTKSAEGLEALLPDVNCTALDGLSMDSSGRRLPRLIATVRHALAEWKKWEQDGFPLD